MDEDELLDNPDAFLDETPNADIEKRWLNADLRLHTPGPELRRRQEADYLGIDPDDY